MSPKKISEVNNHKNEKNEKIGDISTINARKETLNFLGESCLGIK
jgi:hypothetical protein